MVLKNPARTPYRFYNRKLEDQAFSHLFIYKCFDTLLLISDIQENMRSSVTDNFP